MIDMHSSDPMEYVRVALALETLAYHNKDFLNSSIRDNAALSEEVQSLLIQALVLAGVV
jgi:hypothetical protein